MVTKKAFRSIKGKYFHFINHGILQGTKNITNTAHRRTDQKSLFMSDFFKKEKVIEVLERSDLQLQKDE